MTTRPRTTQRGDLVVREAMAIARQGVLMARTVASSVLEHAPSPDLTVFVHGYMAGGGVFGPLAAHLAQTGVARRQLHFTYAPFGSVAQLAVRLASQIRAAQPHGGAVQIVGHSLGGLIARYYRQVLGGRLDRLVCLATPHAGTARAQGFGVLPLAREIAPASATVRLLAQTRAALAGVRVLSVVAEGDVLLAPVDSAALEGHEVVRLAGVGHHSILFDREAWEHTARVLRDPPRSAGDSTAATHDDAAADELRARAG